MAKLPRGRYIIVESKDELVRGRIVDSMRLKGDLEEGIYPEGTLIMHVLTGDLFRIKINPTAVPFKDLTRRQKDRAERYRRVGWPNPQNRPPPRPRKR